MEEVTIRTEDLVSVAQAAEILGKPRINVYRRIQRGEIGVIKFGGRYYIPREQLNK